MIKIKEAVIVEGKYDKIKLSGFIDGLIITTDGFGIFKNREKQALLRRLAEKRGLLILTDSDGAGFVIRNFLKGAVPGEKIYHAYIPDVFGKEKRKEKPSKEGKLGVEGMTESIIADAIKRSGAHIENTGLSFREVSDITKMDFYNYGLTGKDNSAERRDILKQSLSLPSKMSSNALLSVVNCIMTRDEFISLCTGLFGGMDSA